MPWKPRPNDPEDALEKELRQQVGLTTTEQLRLIPSPPRMKWWTMILLLSLSVSYSVLWTQWMMSKSTQ